MLQPTVLARDYFGLTVTEARPLAGEVDHNYRLTTDAGEDYVLKVSPAGQDAGPATFQHALLRHLARKSLPFAVPRPVGDPVRDAGGHLLRLLTWVPGRELDACRPVNPELRRAWGATAARLTLALADFDHPAAPTDYRWNPAQTLDCRPLAACMPPHRAELANYWWDHFAATALSHLAELPRSVCFADAHGQNLLVGPDRTISGVIDFGDAMRTVTAAELAIACAYAGMNCPDPLSAMAEVVAGYVAVAPGPYPTPLFELILGRLLITVATAAENARLNPDNAYLQVSADPAWRLLEQLRDLPPGLATARLRVAYGHPATERAAPFAAWLARQRCHPVIDLAGKSVLPIDLSVGSLDLGGNANFTDVTTFSRHLARWREDRGADYAVGGYGEARPVYTTDDFATEGNAGPRWRSVHLGVDVWGPAGTPVYAPLAGVVHSSGVDPTAGGYGAVLILEHPGPDGQPFYTLYGHLAEESVRHLGARTQVQRGQQIARLGPPAENGGWPPHLHLQLTLDLFGYRGDYPGVAYPAAARTWLGVCPNPAPLLGEALAPETRRFLRLGQQQTGTDLAPEALLAARRRRVGYSLSVSYARPLTVLRGAGPYLYDHTGRRFLDTVNNVAHVGHEHPRVAGAIARQAAVLNTNTRYLHPNLTRLAEELTHTLPPGLSVVHFTNSGSEANELALRMCEAWAGTRNMLAVEVGYHGNTGRTLDVSHYKFAGKGGAGRPPATKVAPLPDVFRGRYRDRNAGAHYAAAAVERLREWTDRGQPVGGLIAESILSCGGQIVPPPGYLAAVYAAVRDAGGLCVADEVQTGLGRVGSHWWSFELQGVVPDIVTIGKPLGNGHPIGAVVCTPKVAERFAGGMEYFNTFGGNPVSCAAGLAVLEVVREEGLRERAAEVGGYLTTALQQLRADFPLIGDVRGAGMFLGFELVHPTPAPASAPLSDHQISYRPATAEAAYLKNRMRELGFLMSTDGPDENVIKIKPPLCFGRAHADQLVDYLARVLAEDDMRME